MDWQITRLPPDFSVSQRTYWPTWNEVEWSTWNFTKNKWLITSKPHQQTVIAKYVVPCYTLASKQCVQHTDFDHHSMKILLFTCNNGTERENWKKNTKRKKNERSSLTSSWVFFLVPIFIISIIWNFRALPFKLECTLTCHCTRLLENRTE